MMDVTRGAHGEVVIRIDGAFEAKDASRLSGWLGEMPENERLVVDFSGVRTCQDFGLAAVARDLSRRNRLVVRGLTRHQERMLRYFGLDLERLPVELREDEEALG